MENMENHFVYTSAQFDLITHILTLGVGAQLGGLLYFVLTRKNSAPRYQLFSVLSIVVIVVMISAALILLNQQLNWTSSFRWDGHLWQRAEQTFSNGYRYVNWSIDVPVLLTQLLVVLGITGARFKRLWLGFTLGGLAMIYTGYVGQFYETTSIPRLLIWGASARCLWSTSATWSAIPSSGRRPACPAPRVA